MTLCHPSPAAPPDTQRRQDLVDDLAQTRLDKNVCLGCKRSAGQKAGSTDFCLYCGLCLFVEPDGCIR
jgi:hypothetical protein